MISVITPSAGVVGLVEYLCTHPIYICGFLRGRPGLRDRKRRIRVVSAPNSACGVGPPQDASASVLL
ncbi:hypothetical protein PAHAL_1G156800 [Panicum hallii]|uniref:Uncharacterized protein n=1 Tax=Panicum hallii TaxID=206008 RepID=A0A2T8KVG0_9POAL|nr:hypothetical protein PAHAL_1G156800 [Panicum hallii]